jgi:hypothetical protein
LRLHAAGLPTIAAAPQGFLAPGAAPTARITGGKLAEQL